MVEDPIPGEPAHADSNTKWILLTVGGGCALLACVALGIVLIGTFLGPQLGGIFSQMNIAQSPQTESATPHPDQIANSMGDPNAPVKIIEYGDFQCPFCRRFWQETEPQIIATYVKPGKVYFEYRPFAFLGPESISAAEAAYCAGDQGRFWEYHDTLFGNWTGENVGDFTPEKLRRYAGMVGLDASQFDACLSSGKYADRVKQDKDSAGAAGVHATPSFLINGKLVEGAQPFEVFQKLIEDTLQHGTQNGVIYEDHLDAMPGGHPVRLADLILRAASIIA